MLGAGERRHRVGSAAPTLNRAGSSGYGIPANGCDASGTSEAHGGWGGARFGTSGIGPGGWRRLEMGESQTRGLSRLRNGCPILSDEV